MMINQIYDRDYHVARSELNRSMFVGIGRFAAATVNAFKVLNRIEYASPWRRSSGDAHWA